MTHSFAPLGDLCTVVTGGTPPRSQPTYWGGEIAWVKISDLSAGVVRQTEERITAHGLENSAAKILPVGTILLSIFASIGRTAVLAVPAATNQAIVGLQIRNPDIVDPSFLRWYLSSAGQALEKQGRGVAQANINTSILKALPVPLPPRIEQRRIAAVLEKAHALRTQRRAALALVGNLVSSIFREMFGDSLSNPMGWKVVRVGSVADVQGGLQVTSARKGLPLEVPYLRVANVHRGRLDLSEIKKIRATEAEVARTMLQPLDLLIVEGHGNADEVGRVAMWTGAVPNCVHQNHLIRVRFDPAKVHPTFACEYLNSQGGRQHLLRSGKTTSGLNTISVSNVRDAPVLMPPLALQQVFAARVAAVEAIKATSRASLAHLDALFASLQHRAFRGEL